MKLRILETAVVAGLTAMSIFAEDAKTDVKPSGPPDNAKVSYALGMSIGSMHKRSEEAKKHTDVSAFTRAIKDTLDDKPTQLKESEIKSILEHVGAEGLAAQPE